jgi:hypothetical protein
MVYEVLPEVVQRFRASLDVNRYAPAAVLIICALLIAPAYVHASEIKYDIYNDGEFRSASSDGILRNQGEYLKVGQWMDSNLRDDSKVLSFEVRRYYIETELVPADSDVVFDTYGTDLEGALRHVQSLGVTHVLDVPKYHDIVMTAPLYDKSPVFQNLDQESFVKIYSWGGAVLYEIDYDMAFGSVIDSGSEETEKQEWLDIRRYLDVEEGTVSALTNSNTTIEMVEAGTTVAISPQKGGAKRLWLDFIVTSPQNFSFIKSGYSANNLTYEQKNGVSGLTYVYAVGSERYYNDGPLTESKPWAIESELTFDVSDYDDGGNHIVFLRKVLI